MDSFQLDLALECDFYQEADLTRGITLGNCLPASDIEYTCLDRELHLPPLWRDFDAGDAAKQLDEETRKLMEGTTSTLNNASATAAASMVLAFLNRLEYAHISKVNYTKFTIRAHAALTGHPCDIKVRIYELGNDSLVEFQKRSGDAVSFANIFQAFSFHLEEPSKDIVASYGLPEAPEVCLPHCSVVTDTVPVLLEIAATTYCSKLISEVAFVLLAAVQHDSLATAKLDTPCASEFRQRLQAAEGGALAYPCQQLLTCM